MTEGEHRCIYFTLFHIFPTFISHWFHIFLTFISDLFYIFLTFISHWPYKLATYLKQVCNQLQLFWLSVVFLAIFTFSGLPLFFGWVHIGHTVAKNTRKNICFQTTWLRIKPISPLCEIYTTTFTVTAAYRRLIDEYDFIFLCWKHFWLILWLMHTVHNVEAKHIWPCWVCAGHLSCLNILKYFSIDSSLSFICHSHSPWNICPQSISILNCLLEIYFSPFRFFKARVPLLLS